MKSASFDLLHPAVQQVVLDQGWTNLHPIQEDAIRAFAASSADLILAAPTSGGKTEAGFLPIISELLAVPLTRCNSVRALAISPLKALINDQFNRLQRMCEPLGIAVHRWHGDVDMEAKRRLRERPNGILFITPESLESLFINFPHRVLPMFKHLNYVVVDELHSLLESERGMHVRSLLARLCVVIDRRPRYLGLSATLGDPLAARAFLNQDNSESVRVISDRSTARPISVEVVSIADDAIGPSPSSFHDRSGTLAKIAEDLRTVFSDGSYLVFGNSRRTVEELGDHFLGQCELAIEGEPAVALHHGSLSARVRRQTESLLKSGTPTRALCTSSLELGIDIGSVEAVAQIDPTWSVSSMVQRLGRSGRKLGATSKLRLYVRAPPSGPNTSLVDLLYPQLLQSIAVVKLVLAGWLEPVAPSRTHLSTLVHQVLSALKEAGGRSASALYQSLCCTGPFRRVETTDFELLLRSLYSHDLINQDDEGILFLGEAGERVTSAPGFYAAFSTPQELTVRFGAKELGRLPVNGALKEGECILLNGRRWLVDSINWKSKSIWVSPTAIKKASVFLGGVGEIHDRIFQEMRQVLLATEQPEWLDAKSLELLQAARDMAVEGGLIEGDLLELDGGVQWFPWVGTRTMRTLGLWAKKSDINCTKDALSLTFEHISYQDFLEHLGAFAELHTDAVDLAELMPNKRSERFDVYVPEQLLDEANATDRLDLTGAKNAARRTLHNEQLVPVII